MLTGYAARYVTPERFLSFPAGATGSASSDTTRSATAAATSSKTLAANLLSGVAIATALAFWL
jgi:hypothetical protein